MESSRDLLPGVARNGPVVVEVWAPWCGSCRALAPRVRTAAAAAGVPVVRLRVDADPGLVEAFGLRSVPTLIGLRDGTEVGRLVGVQPPDAIRSLCSATGSGIGTVTTVSPRSLAALRTAAGTALIVGGLATSAPLLTAIGAGLVAWVLAGRSRC
jgi:thioredoxin-like negative regulator of GroEL